MNIHLFIQFRVEEVERMRFDAIFPQAPNGGRPKCPTRNQRDERVQVHPSKNLHRKLRVRISTFPTTTTTSSCFFFIFFFSPPRILATLVVPCARARGLQFGLSLILRFFLLIHCNTKHDQCIIVSELVHPKNKQVLRSTFLGLRKTF